MVKENAPELLRRELASRKWEPQELAMSGVTDCYQPIERRLQLTRRCLASAGRVPQPGQHHHQELPGHARPGPAARTGGLAGGASQFLDKLPRPRSGAPVSKPRASSPRQRLAAVELLANAGVPVGVLVAPVIPALTDHEIPSVLAAAKAAGAVWAGTEVLRLPLAVAPIFEQWLQQHVPGKKDKILGRIRALRAGKLNDPRFGSRMRGEGIFAEQISQMFHVARRRAGIPEDGPELSTTAFRRPAGAQFELGLGNG